MKHPMNLDDISRFLASQNKALSDHQKAQMRSYLDLIHRWSGRQNLVSRHDLPLLIERHFLPSLFLDACLPERLTGDLMDLGSGAGFPGVLLAIMRPALPVTLLDASRKRTLFLEEVCIQLSLNCRVICQRCEPYAREAGIKYRTIVVRAVASIERLLKWTQPLQGNGDMLYVLKGGDNLSSALEEGTGHGNSTILRPGTAWTTFSVFMQYKYILRVER